MAPWPPPRRGSIIWPGWTRLNSQAIRQVQSFLGLRDQSEVERREREQRTTKAFFLSIPSFFRSRVRYSFSHNTTVASFYFAPFSADQAQIHAHSLSLAAQRAGRRNTRNEKHLDSNKDWAFLRELMNFHRRPVSSNNRSSMLW